MKINKTQKAALWQIHRCGGAVMTSHWTNGIGRYTRSRAVPPFCKRIERYRAEDYPKRIQRVFRLHPRCQAVIAIVDMRAANRALALREVRT